MTRFSVLAQIDNATGHKCIGVSKIMLCGATCDPDACKTMAAV